MANSPTIRRRRVARELRQLRMRAGLTLEQAAEQLDMSKSNLSRVENAQVGVKPRDVRAFLAVYGVLGEAAETLIEIARGARERGWWQNYSDVFPEGFEFYVGLEADAVSICSYEAEPVPGLLQTEEYARAIEQATFTGDVERAVAARLTRQQTLRGNDPDGQEPPELSSVLNEGVLLRPVGGAAVMRRQLDHLVEMAALPNVTIQVLPFRAGAHPAMTTPYVILTFPDATEEPIVFLDNLTQGLALEEEQHVQGYRKAHETLCKMALTPEASIERIHQAASELS